MVAIKMEILNAKIKHVLTLSNLSLPQTVR